MAALAVMTSIGSQTRLFNTICVLPASTSEQIATAAELNERYVREWLGAMVSGEIVDYNPVDETYWMQPGRARVLGRGSKGQSWTDDMQFILDLAPVQQQVIECFRFGAGVSPSAFSPVRLSTAVRSIEQRDDLLLAEVVPLVPGAAARLTSGIDVADIGCGDGHVSNLLGKTYPKSRFVGYDFAAECIEAGREEADQFGLTNSRFEVRDAAALDLEDEFDLVFAFDSIHMQAQRSEVLLRIARALRIDGTFLMVDFASSSRLERNVDHPLAPFMYAQSCLHCMPVSLALGGDGVGATWGEENAMKALSDAGFADVKVTRIESDILHSYYVATFAQTRGLGSAAHST